MTYPHSQPSTYAQQIPTDMAYLAKAFQDCLNTMAVAYFATLTTVQRVIPPVFENNVSVANRDCLDSARKALQIHQELVLNSRLSRDEYTCYVTWYVVPPLQLLSTNAQNQIKH